jgi:hypothetical protein
MRQFKGKIIEIMPELGNQLAALYPEKFNYDITCTGIVGAFNRTGLYFHLARSV